jgi:ferritin-like metal-binding protein YciE
MNKTAGTVLERVGDAQSDIPMTQNTENQTIMSGSDTENAAASDMMDTGGRLYEFFLEELRDIYWAEQHLIITLPKMEAAAYTQALKTAFVDHLAETRNHVVRLEQAFKLLGEEAEGKKCEAIAGITKEGEEIIEETEAGTATRDVGLILAAQKVEHYEIATYGGLAQLAKTLGITSVAELLHTTLEEEKKTDHLLTDIAENSVNYKAKKD